MSGLFFVTLQIECGMGNLGSGMIDWIIKKDLSYDKSIVHPYQMIED